ncbi:23S rRNA m(1)G-745 methyltransferase [Halopseudomonas xinjiangensis]|uniref:23S rRNA m(1)G-745 methyltransferase n=1 Tax=Halopseudomonas xinjiangensis TaxID=487184 RepID=A0A1H1V3J1_9GAMM|nr:methyltransferase domain-containing protein [Halopseudomonas xinjiangensis]SDS78946.1 23S rRNA m(1)G-745 methyltransferase [Halopseudomonas xinjiangensis]
MLELICPICHQALTNLGQQWRCDNGHSYDQARQGYLNLLMVQHKNSRQPGDTPAMLACRQAFLDAGHYQPVSETINRAFLAQGPGTLLDMGCGEGYYTARLASVLSDSEVGGLDISKDAVIRATRRSRDLRWLVASSARLPVADASLDALLSVFSPWSWDECLRTLKPGGHLMLVGPHADHLRSLRAALYDDVHATPDLLKEPPPELQVVSDKTLRYPLELEATDLANLIGMTPHSLRSAPDRQRHIIETGLVGLEVAMRLVILQRC